MTSCPRSRPCAWWVKHAWPWRRCTRKGSSTALSSRRTSSWWPRTAPRLSQPGSSTSAAVTCWTTTRRPPPSACRPLNTWPRSSSTHRPRPPRRQMSTLWAPYSAAACWAARPSWAPGTRSSSSWRRWIFPCPMMSPRRSPRSWSRPWPRARATATPTPPPCVRPWSSGPAPRRMSSLWRRSP